MKGRRVYESEKMKRYEGVGEKETKNKTSIKKNKPRYCQKKLRPPLEAVDLAQKCVLSSDSVSPAPELPLECVACVSSPC